jgi:Holliday junction resolvasome RuvABC endonuclease subunit
MLSMPADSPREIAIVGIDPGSVHLGTAVLHIDLATLRITSTTARTFDARHVSTLLPETLWTSQLFGERLGRIASLEDALLSLLLDVDPHMIVCEAPFINLRRPQAHGVLTEVICGIRRAVMRYDAWKPLYLIDPASVKNAVGAKGNADKDAMRSALLHLPALCYDGNVPLRLLDEHSIDAIAVGYSHWKAWMEVACSTS